MPSTSPPPHNLPCCTTSHETPSLRNTIHIKFPFPLRNLLLRLPHTHFHLALPHPRQHTLKASHTATIGTDHARAESRRHRMEMVLARDGSVARRILSHSAPNRTLVTHGFVYVFDCLYGDNLLPHYRYCGCVLLLQVLASFPLGTCRACTTLKDQTSISCAALLSQ